MISKRLIIEIGYNKFIISEKDAIRLLAIASRCIAIERGASWQDPYHLKADNTEPFIGGTELVEVEFPDDPDASTAPQPSIYTAAARGLP